LVVRKVYLSGPIMYVSPEESYEWRKVAEEKLEGFKVLNPLRRNFRDGELLSVNEIVEFDLADIRETDIVLVNYSKPSIGTAMEVFYANQLGKFIVAFTQLPRNDLNAWMVRHCTRIVSSLDEAINYIKIHFGGDSD